MAGMNRRSAFTLALAAASVAAAPAEAARAQAATVGKEIAPGVQRVNLGKRASMIPAYKSVSMFDVVYQPKAKLATGVPMANDMVCHCPEGELRVRQTPGGSSSPRRAICGAATKVSWKRPRTSAPESPSCG